MGLGMKQKIKLTILILCAVYALYYLITINSWHFIDNVDLVIHEGGHIVFFPFGTFLYIAGGSLMQIIMPSLFIGYFYRAKDFFAVSLLLNWLAVNFFSVGRYAADAVVMQLELLGGDSSGHDWHNLLQMTHLLGLTTPIADLIYLLGIVSVGASLYFALNIFYIDKPKQSGYR
jgi:hypothetical protein